MAGDPDSRAAPAAEQSWRGAAQLPEGDQGQDPGARHVAHSASASMSATTATKMTASIFDMRHMAQGPSRSSRRIVVVLVLCKITIPAGKDGRSLP